MSGGLTPGSVGGPPAPLGNPDEYCRVIARNLRPGFSREDLQEVFGRYGAIVEVHIPSNTRGMMGRGDINKPAFGFIEFQTQQAGKAAIAALNGAHIKGFGPATVRIADGTKATRAEMLQREQPMAHIARKDAVWKDNSSVGSQYLSGCGQPPDSTGPSVRCFSDYKRARDSDDDDDDFPVRGDFRGSLPEPLRQALAKVERVRRELRRERAQRGHLQLQLLALAEKGSAGPDEADRKLGKYKAKLEKYREAERVRAEAGSERRRKAVCGGAEGASDDDINFLSQSLGQLTASDAWGILALPPGSPDAPGHAKRLMARLHPDRVPLDICKAGLRARFQLVQHARDLLLPVTAGAVGGGAAAPPPAAAAPAAEEEDTEA